MGLDCNNYKLFNFYDDKLININLINNKMLEFGIQKLIKYNCHIDDNEIFDINSTFDYLNKGLFEPFLSNIKEISFTCKSFNKHIKVNINDNFIELYIESNNEFLKIIECGNKVAKQKGNIEKDQDDNKD